MMISKTQIFTDDDAAVMIRQQVVGLMPQRIKHVRQNLASAKFYSDKQVHKM
jgi:hypothetical protein